MGMLKLIRENAHRVDVDGHAMLMHVPTTSLFELDPVARDLYDLSRGVDAFDADSLRAALGHHGPDALADCVKSFMALDILRDAADANTPRTIVRVEDIPLSTIILNVNTGCNLACTYCYKEDLAVPSKGEKMSFDTARASVELLLKQAAGRDRVNIVFFGGEPLSNMPLIRQVVEWAGPRAAELGKVADFSLTTNATLLTPELADWFDAHRFALTVSMDGPKALHDTNRKTVGGKGTYDLVARNVRMLLSRYRSRPVGARVTLTRGVTDVIAIHDHLRGDLGFAEVGFGPATSGPISVFNLDATALKQAFEDMKTLGRRYTEAACRGENIGFSNMHQLLTDIAQGTKKAVPCGAGLGMLAVDRAGDLHLCHRFVGSDQPTYGNVDTGIDLPRLGAFIEKAQDRSGMGCTTCRIRAICAGGCYHESYARQGDPFAPVYHYCDLMRDWVDFGIQSYVRIMQANPSFFRTQLEPRIRPAQEVIQ
ncbi:MAG: quinohemoprotein amine dehydrogenase maturation protein [Paracoccus sp. (in: a-proteobacteria)]|uniref:quinohemoprotein amine dehydrogenase maturation protein n=1 Tax=Paracoccus sp. TaxID=267 RepID=UPI0026DEBDD9|nr:quinohemoprotein amine dehydrogenase maturation protein [Paracoccus sp. (in: a-proteobacteria)]MDO5632035.1 quinohemoprotein amine dehydrogenase maturation protein [Paracoccus sp. (in: a-proteobacteria)]